MSLAPEGHKCPNPLEKAMAALATRFGSAPSDAFTPQVTWQDPKQKCEQEQKRKGEEREREPREKYERYEGEENEWREKQRKAKEERDQREPIGVPPNSKHRAVPVQGLAEEDQMPGARVGRVLLPPSRGQRQQGIRGSPHYQA